MQEFIAGSVETEPFYHQAFKGGPIGLSMRKMARGKPISTIVAILIGTVLFLSACDPFVARVKGGSESKPEWEIGVKF